MQICISRNPTLHDALLILSELTATEEAEHLAKRKEVWEAMQAAKLANMPLGGASYRSANSQSDSVSQSRAAELLNVGTRTVAAAAKVERESPEVFEQIGTGGLSVNLASQVSELPPDEKQAVVAARLANIAQGQFTGNQHVPSANLQTPAVSQSRAAAAPPKSASKPAT